MDHKELNILFWNVRSISRRRDELPYILSTVDIFICVETWLSSVPINKFTIPGFQIFRKDRTHTTGGGILIAIRKSWDARELNELISVNDKFEIYGIKIKNITATLEIIGNYWKKIIIVNVNTNIIIL